MKEYHQSLRTRKILALVLILIPSISFAGSMNSGIQMRLSIPWSQVQKALETEVDKSPSIVKELSSQALQISEFAPVIKSGRIEFLGLNKSQIQIQESKFDFSVNDTFFKIEMSGFSLNQDVVRYVDGIKIIARIQAECGPFSVQQGFRRIHASYQYQFDAQKMQGSFGDFALESEPSQFQISGLTCVGPGGLGSYIQEQIRQFAATPAFLSSEVKKILEPKLSEILNTQIGALVSGVQLPTNSLFKAKSKILLREVRQSASGLQAEIDWILDDLNNPLIPAPMDAEIGQAADLRISLDGFRFLFEKSLEAQPEWARFRANDFEAFRKVLSSRFVQFFVWPDLFSFSKSAEFPLLVRKPKIDAMTLSEQGVSIRGSTLAWLQGPRDGKYWNYLALQGQMNGRFRPAIEKGVLVLKPQGVSTGLQIGFGAEYVQQFRPNMWIATSMVRPLLDSLMNEQVWNFALPEIRLTSKQKIQASGLSVQGQTLSIRLAPSE